MTDLEEIEKRLDVIENRIARILHELDEIALRVGLLEPEDDRDQTT